MKEYVRNLRVGDIVEDGSNILLILAIQNGDKSVRASEKVHGMVVLRAFNIDIGSKFTVLLNGDDVIYVMQRCQ